MNIVNRDQLATRIRKAREYLGLVPSDVAEFLGIHRFDYSNIESAKRWISPVELQKLSILLRQPLSYFLSEYHLPAVLSQQLQEIIETLPETDQEEIKLFAQFLQHRKETKK